MRILKYRSVQFRVDVYKVVFSLTFLVLDNKAPKAEDIDEEDDDVPGMKFGVSSIFKCSFFRDESEVILSSLLRSRREL